MSVKISRQDIDKAASSAGFTEHQYHILESFSERRGHTGGGVDLFEVNPIVFLTALTAVLVTDGRTEDAMELAKRTTLEPMNFGASIEWLGVAVGG